MKIAKLDSSENMCSEGKGLEPTEQRKDVCNNNVENGDINGDVVKNKGPQLAAIGRSGNISGSPKHVSYNVVEALEAGHEKVVHPSISKYKKQSLMQAMRRSLSEVGNEIYS